MRKVKIIEGSEEYRSKIVGYKYDFWKFFLGTFILGAAAAISTYIFKNYELKIASREAESKYLSTYLDKFISDKDTLRYDKALIIADFISRTSLDPDLKQSWIDYRNFAKHICDSVHRKVDSTKQATSKIVNDANNSIKENLTKLSALKKKHYTEPSSIDINKYKADSTALMQQVNSFQNQLQAAVQENRKTVLEAKQILSEPAVTSIISASNYEVVYDYDRYTGINYFITVTDGIKINVDDYSGTAGVKMRISYLEQEKEFYIKEGSTKSFDAIKIGNNSYRLTITLNKYQTERNFLKKIGVAYYHVTVEQLVKS